MSKGIRLFLSEQNRRIVEGLFGCGVEELAPLFL